MDKQAVRQLLLQVADGALSPDAALERLRDLPFEDIGFAHVDHHRALRTGYPEVIFAQGKTLDQIVAIAQRLLARGSSVLVTRLAPTQQESLAQRFGPPAFRTHTDPLARTAVVRAAGVRAPALRGRVVVVSGGTADLPVVQEVVVTARAMGARAEAIVDVGVAGLHRLLAYQAQLRAARVIVVVAGMEGALASVVGGLAAVPVIAVPTSIGYGATFGGLAALLTMLNSCAAGVLVTNIDNGFGAGYAAALINQAGRRTRP